VFVHPWPAGPSLQRWDQMIYYQFRADRAGCTPRHRRAGRRAAKAVAGLTLIERNRFIALDGSTKSI
jgi:hypothetical protein